MSFIPIQQVVEKYRDTETYLYLTVDTRDLRCHIEECESFPVSFDYDVNEVLEHLYSIPKGEWFWIKNFKFKYVKLLVDTKNKVCLIYDRHGKLSTLEDFKYQYKGEK